jgi:hypothetical protein
MSILILHAAPPFRAIAAHKAWDSEPSPLSDFLGEAFFFGIFLVVQKFFAAASQCSVLKLLCELLPTH